MARCLATTKIQIKVKKVSDNPPIYDKLVPENDHLMLKAMMEISSTNAFHAFDRKLHCA